MWIKLVGEGSEHAPCTQVWIFLSVNQTKLKVTYRLYYIVKKGKKSELFLGG